MTSLLQFVRRLTEVPALTYAPDRDLVERFAGDGDNAAFAAIIRRHGAMVLGVCNRIVFDKHHAEDCFQAVFVILARKAGSLGAPEQLGNWLYGVARRTALRSAASLERPSNSRNSDESSFDDPLDALIKRDQRLVLDDELQRLPNKYRAPMVLHYLEGRTTQETARALGCPQGTVMTRLARGRERLRGRLSQRGITLSVGLLTSETLSAAVPTGLMESTLRIASLMTGGGSVVVTVSAEVAVLAQGVISAMFWSKCVMTAALVAAVSGVGTGAGLFLQLNRDGQTVAIQPAQIERAVNQEPAGKAEIPPMVSEVPRLSDQKIKSLLSAAEGDRKLKALLADRHAAAVMEARARYSEFMLGRGFDDALVASAQRVLRSELELCRDRPDRLAVRENYMKLIKSAHDTLEERYNAGRVPIQSLKGMEFQLRDAEIELEREKTR